MTALTRLWTRVRSKGRRTLADRLVRRPLALTHAGPIVSFTFDDAPCTAFDRGARILEAHGARATYYMCFDLLGTTSEIGPIARPEQVERALIAGHELGCHTFDHSDAWHTPSARFVRSVRANASALASMLPGCSFRSFAYPKSGATAAAKARIATRFECCRGGGQTYNAGTADLNLLRACFIDRRAGLGEGALARLIEANARCGGWLIFAAHDVSDDDTAFSCRGRLLERLLRLSLESGARVLPVARAKDAWVQTAPQAT
jgi:peptidoglycan/xylan/chitin deacetylase (PgdA/CDA1 family)